VSDYDHPGIDYRSLQQPIEKTLKDLHAEESQREAQAALGVKYDQGKPMIALIPPLALEEEAKVWTFGMNKYGAWNWAKGLVYLRITSAALRHILAIMMGQDVDPESGFLHAAHVRCCMGMLIHFVKTGRTDLDDRLKQTKGE
jgi:hypothetical protein